MSAAFKTDLYSHFSTFAGLAALVGKRIKPLEQTQNLANPCLGYQIIPGGERIHSHSGFSSLERFNVQVSVFADDALEATQIADQVILATQAWGAINPKVQRAWCPVTPGDAFNDPTGCVHIPVDISILYG